MLLEYGDIIYSPGCAFPYRVIGPVCRLFDRETLEYPHCRIEWKDCRGNGKAPSWRRQGKRFVADLATKKHPSYGVELIGCSDIIHLTLFSKKLTEEEQDWWYPKALHLQRFDQGQETVKAA